MDVNSFTQLVGAVPSGGYITETSAKPSDQQSPLTSKTQSVTQHWQRILLVARHLCLVLQNSGADPGQ